MLGSYYTNHIVGLVETHMLSHSIVGKITLDGMNIIVFRLCFLHSKECEINMVVLIM